MTSETHTQALERQNQARAYADEHHPDRTEPTEEEYQAAEEVALTRPPGKSRLAQLAREGRSPLTDEERMTQARAAADKNRLTGDDRESYLRHAEHRTATRKVARESERIRFLRRQFQRERQALAGETPQGQIAAALDSNAKTQAMIVELLGRVLERLED